MKILTLLAKLTLPLLFWYIIGAILLWEFNLENWGEDARTLAIVAYFLTLEGIFSND